MNTRQAIQPSNQPVVLSISFSPSRKRFVTGLSEGCRIFRSDNCLTTYQPSIATDGREAHVLDDGGIGVAAVLNDRYLAFAGGGRAPQCSPNAFTFWDALLGRSVCSLDLHEPILGIRLSHKHAAVILQERTVIFDYQEIVSQQQQPTPPSSPTPSSAESLFAPNKVRSIYQTASNPYAIGVLQAGELVLPAQSTGQVQLIPLPAGSKRVLRAHTSALRTLALSDDGKLLATASVQGTLIRVFDTATLDQIAEFRRGVDHAIISSLAISPRNRWVACTSDKGTLHIFDMRPNDSKATISESNKPSQAAHRKSTSHPMIRIPSATITPSLNSAARSSSPGSMAYQGSVQEYYGLLPPPSSASPTSPTTAISALGAFKHSSLAPRLLKDVRSVASAPFWVGDERPYWQGGAAWTSTTAPDGKRLPIKNPVLPLANDPTGRPVKGVVAFAPGEKQDDEGAVLYVVGGGSDARWEMFELVPLNGGGGWALVNKGHRKYLTRQFVD